LRRYIEDNSRPVLFTGEMVFPFMFDDMPGRGLHLFTFQLNVSAFCRIWGALRGCFGGV